MFIHTYRARPRPQEEFDFYNVAAFTLQKGMLKPMSDWCHQTFGIAGNCEDRDRWEDQIWFGEVWFRDEKDLAIFLLRWS